MASDQEDLEVHESPLHDTYFPPISNLVSALGGVEDTLNEATGEVERVYRLGDECLGESDALFTRSVNKLTYMRKAA